MNDSTTGDRDALAKVILAAGTGLCPEGIWQRTADRSRALAEADAVLASDLWNRLHVPRSLTDLAESRRVALLAAMRERDDAKAANERDRSAVCAGVEALKRAIASRDWLRDGRGPFAYDDDRYQREFGDALDELRTALEPLAKIAGDHTDCPKTWSDVQAARTGQPAPPSGRPVGEVIQRIRQSAANHGWAIGVHGSLRRDIDLIATPWTGAALDWRTMVDAVAAAISYETDRAPTTSAHGRICVLLIAKGADNDQRRFNRGDTTEEPSPKGRWYPPAIDLSIIDPRAQSAAAP